MRKSGILSQPRGAPIKAFLKDSWPWSAARISHHLGATLRPRSWTSIARAFGGSCKRPLHYQQRQPGILACPLGLGSGSAPALQSEYFQMDIAGPNERPTHIGF